ncbi:MAG TPA: SRPBCC family protein [Solirubrobacteraceae bacterium]|nr:SRPBCC family protein [Solirubrobacteraceae bacterium]
MAEWMTQATCHGTPDDVLGLLTEPGAIARWSPVPFTIVDEDRDRLCAGDRVRVRGELVGRGVEFLVDVDKADDGHLALTATGPIRIDVDYRVVGDAAGSNVCARIGVAGSGLFGRVLAGATDAMLAAGALRMAVERIARELEPAVLVA